MFCIEQHFKFYFQKLNMHIFQRKGNKPLVIISYYSDFKMV